MFVKVFQVFLQAYFSRSAITSSFPAALAFFIFSAPENFWDLFFLRYYCFHLQSFFRSCTVQSFHNPYFIHENFWDMFFLIYCCLYLLSFRGLAPFFISFSAISTLERVLLEVLLLSLQYLVITSFIVVLDICYNPS